MLAEKNFFLLLRPELIRLSGCSPVQCKSASVPPIVGCAALHSATGKAASWLQLSSSGPQPPLSPETAVPRPGARASTGTPHWVMSVPQHGDTWSPAAMSRVTCPSPAEVVSPGLHTWGIELETKVHPKVRNHGEGPY